MPPQISAQYFLSTTFDVTADNTRMGRPRTRTHEYDFYAVRDTVLRRDGHLCQYCKIERGPRLEVHHKDGDRTNNALDNLTTLCARCHQAHHGTAHKRKCHDTALLPVHKQVFERDGYHCLLCFKRQAPASCHVHVVDGDTSNKALGNMLTLCMSCHRMSHSYARQLADILPKLAR